MNVIELHAARKMFGKRVAVDNFDLSVRSGEIFGLLGHNGAGKSTVIGMLLGQVWPTGGAVRVFGHDVTGARARALEKVGAIFETPVFYDYLTGWQNLQILSHYSAPTPVSRIREVIGWVGLAGREHSKVRTYSHGMRARLALAQALLPDPQLLILDEPSDGLDPEGIHEMRQTILRLHSELGLTIFLSSHLLNEVEQLCTRITIMRQGKKVFDGGVASVNDSGHWMRLRVSDFELACRELLARRMIDDVRAGCRIRLAPGIGADEVVRRLVELGFAVFEIAAEKQTLEDFYLSLVNSSGLKT